MWEGRNNHGVRAPCPVPDRPSQAPLHKVTVIPCRAVVIISLYECKYVAQRAKLFVPAGLAMFPGCLLVWGYRTSALLGPPSITANVLAKAPGT